MNEITSDDADLFIDPETDYYNELVGEGRKYKDNKALAFAKMHADVTIARREEELSNLREELATRLSLEKFLDKLNTQQSDPGSQTQDDDQMDKSAISTQDLRKLVEENVALLDRERSAKQNEAQFNARLSEVYGPNSTIKLRQEASNLGMTEPELRALAARNPKAAFKLLGFDSTPQRETFESAPRSQVNSFSAPGSKRGYSWYWNNIYKNPDKGPTEFYSPRVQNEMSQAMQTMGKEAFLNS